MEAFQAVPKVVRFWRRIRGEYLRASGEHMFWCAMSAGDEESGRKLATEATERIIEGCEVIRACEREKSQS